MTPRQKTTEPIQISIWDWLSAKKLWRLLRRHNGKVQVLSAVLLAVAGIVSNVTAAPFFKDVCGAEGGACWEAALFFVKRPEGWAFISGLLLQAVSVRLNAEISEAKAELEAAIADRDSALEAIANLEQQLASYRIDSTDVLSSILRVFAAGLDLTASERISLYQYAEGNFFILGRHSPNPEFKAIRRRYYAADQGVIYQAWQFQWAEYLVRTNPHANFPKYCKEISDRFNIPRDVVRNFKMKTRAYRAIVIRDTMGNHAAVLCFESTERNGLDHVQRTELERSCEIIGVLLAAIGPHIASITDAAAEGI